MSDQAISIFYDTKKADAMFAKFPKTISNYLTQIYNMGGILGQRIMREKAPRGVSGIGLRETITYEVFTDHAIVKPQKKYGKYDATVVEKGRLPGKMPPWKEEWNPDFYKWATSKGIDPFILARSIGRKGTKATNFVKKTRVELEPKIKAIAKSKMDDMITELNK